MYEVIKDRLILRRDQYGRIYEKDLAITLGEVFHVPKPLRHLIIEELLQLELIKVEGTQFKKRIFIVNTKGLSPSHHFCFF